MLKRLLESWRDLRIPDHVLPVFIVVENHSRGDCRTLVENLADDFAPHALVYEIAEDPGIPSARNAAIDTALGECADFVLFVDDDESVSENWLVEMVRTYRESGAALIGGPVLARFENNGHDFLTRLMIKGVKARYERIVSRAHKKLSAGKAGQIAIDTSNWFADVRLFREFGLRFDTGLRTSGGSDTKFYNDVRKLNKFQTTWSPDAIVYETVPRERLTPGYQYYRGMQQSRNSIHRKLESQSRILVFPSIIGNILIRIVTITLLILGLPFNTASNIVRILRSAGWISGRVTGFFGARSNLYKT